MRGGAAVALLRAGTRCFFEVVSRGCDTIKGVWVASVKTELSGGYCAGVVLVWYEYQPLLLLIPGGTCFGPAALACSDTRQFGGAIFLGASAVTEVKLVVGGYR